MAVFMVMLWGKLRGHGRSRGGCRCRQEIAPRRRHSLASRKWFGNLIHRMIATFWSTHRGMSICGDVMRVRGQRSTKRAENSRHFGNCKGQCAFSFGR
jgi:hypothetical protein